MCRMHQWREAFPVFRPSFHILVMCTGHVLEASKFALLIKLLDIEELSLENRCFHKHIIFAGGLAGCNDVI